MTISRRQFLTSNLAAAGTLAMMSSGLASASSSRYGIVGQPAPELTVDYWLDKDGRQTSFKLADHPSGCY